MPTDLTQEQKDAVEQLSKVMNGNPRERILRAAGRSLMAARRTTTRITARVDHDRGVFMISVAAELAEMHPQTLRMYEQRGLIEPKRSPKGTRLYSQADVERLRRIQEMTTEWGMNLAGVERVFELEEQLDRMQRKVGILERRAEQLSGGDRAAGGEARVRQGRARPLRGRARDRAHPHPPRQAAVASASSVRGRTTPASARTRLTTATPTTIAIAVR